MSVPNGYMELATSAGSEDGDVKSLVHKKERAASIRTAMLRAPRSKMVVRAAAHPALTRWAKLCRASGAGGWKSVGGVYRAVWSSKIGGEQP